MEIGKLRTTQTRKHGNEIGLVEKGRQLVKPKKSKTGEQSSQSNKQSSGKMIPKFGKTQNL